jgi:hypothetical protein
VQVLDVEGERFELKFWAGNADELELHEERWAVVRSGRGDLYGGNTLVSSNHGDIGLDYLDDSPTFATIEPGTESEPEYPDDGVVAVDIETLTTVPESQFDFEDSTHVELLCVGVGYAPSPNTSPVADVLFREGRDAQAEEDLLVAVCEWIEARDPGRVVTFKGDYDRRHLPGRAALLTTDGSPLHQRVEAVFTERHWDNIDPYGSLEDAADIPPTYWDIYQHSLDPADWRTEHSGPIDDPEVKNYDIPHIGDAYLEAREEAPGSRTARALRELLYQYTVRDIRPLFALVE